MKSKYIYFFWLLVLFISCRHDVELPPISLQECEPMPNAVAAGCSYTYNNEIYIFGGRLLDGKHTNQHWRYTPQSDTWTKLESAPLKARVSCSACVVDECAYIGLGYSGYIHRDSSYLCDFWKYNLITHEWKRLADYPANTTVKNCFVKGDGCIYALYGFNRQFTQDVYRYDIEKDQWDKMDVYAPASVPRAMDVVGASCQERHFIGTGFNHGSLRFWAEWNPEKQQFLPRKQILGMGRNAASCCATDEYVYLIGGRHYGDTLTTGFFYSSIQRYTPQEDKWEYVGDMPYEAENMVVECVGGTIYVGMGENPKGIIQNYWYKIEE